MPFAFRVAPGLVMPVAPADATENSRFSFVGKRLFEIQSKTILCIALLLDEQMIGRRGCRRWAYPSAKKPTLPAGLRDQIIFS